MSSRSLTLLLGITLCVIPSLIVATAAAQEESPVDLVAIDADIAGNEATVLGPLDGCISADVNSEVTVDVVVDSVPEDRFLLATQLTIKYDQSILEVTGVDNAFLLAAKDRYEPVEGLSDTLPDSDGSLLIVVADIASDIETGESIENGPGVLSRITFNTLAQGASEVALGFDPGEEYPALIDDKNTIMQVDNIGAATVAVGQSCSANAEPKIEPLPSIAELEAQHGDGATPAPVPEVVDEGDGGINIPLLIGAAALAVGGVAGTAAGVFMLRRLRRS